MNDERVMECSEASNTNAEDVQTACGVRDRRELERVNRKVSTTRYYIRKPVDVVALDARSALDRLVDLPICMVKLKFDSSFTVGDAFSTIFVLFDALYEL